MITGPSDFKDGGGGEEYLGQLKGMAEGNNVEFTGPVYNQEDLVAYYAKAIVFCYPSQDWGGDAAPVAPREAMAYGCVPLVSEVECFNDLVTEGKNGLKFNQNAHDQPKALVEKLNTLLSDSDKLKTMADECKAVNERFSPSVIAEAFIKDFHKIKQYNS
jgi:glycosyltransferase involved in cell wall biosynthesis